MSLPVFHFCHPREEKTMKITRFLFVMLILVSILAACAQPATPPPAEPQQPAATEAPAKPAQAEPVKLVIWWWGEQEAPGAQQWLDETIAEYQKLHPNVTIEAVLQSTDSLIPAFQSAAAAQQGPDIQYFWGGVWTLEFAWNGALVPLDDLIPAEERAHYINNFERTYDGKLWGMGWYLSGNPMVYNPTLFEKAGIDLNDLPDTWDELIAACDKLNAIGVTPISGGLKDGWFGGWLFSILGRQNLDSEKDFMKASIGEAKFTDPAYAEWWERLHQLKEAKCWNADINSVDYQQGQDQFVQGKSAMIFGNDTFLKGWAEIIGWNNMGVMRVPKYGSGKLADTYVVTAQGLGITSWSKHKKEAADFLMFTHTPDRLNAWFKYTGVLPADDRFDTTQIDQPILKKIFEWVVQSAGPNLENFIPSMLDEQAFFAGTQLLFAGDKTPAELAQLTEEVIQKWREQNPDQLQHFINWYKK
jgi:multiple sugar transport system substrate-binding protein